MPLYLGHNRRGCPVGSHATPSPPCLHDEEGPSRLLAFAIAWAEVSSAVLWPTRSPSPSHSQKNAKREMPGEMASLSLPETARLKENLSRSTHAPPAPSPSDMRP